ncbi:MAG: Ig-like domain-containing protein [Firmicutes bacterium]|nr:Ig-like domain-containing protein [Bacillota bacterium]
MKKILALTLSIAMIFATLPASASAQKKIEVDSFGKVYYKSVGFEYDDPKVTVPGKTIKSKLPSSYDLRDQGRVTGVKDQGNSQYCWAFASLASIESNLITKGLAGKSIDLSEAHLAYHTFNGRSESPAGKYAGRDTCNSASGAANYYTAAATLVRGYGPVSENLMPYSVMNRNVSIPSKYTTEKVKTSSAYDIQSASIISSNSTTTQYDEAAANAAKELIMKNGAVASKYYFPDDDDWTATFGTSNPYKLKAYFGPGEFPSHAITIIGWDDSFNDFTMENRPPGPGAWIVKDSYGTDLHGDGYFYLSYYCPSLTQFISFTASKKSNRRIYQYDGTGICDYILYKNSAVSAANCFTARNDELLDQVMVFTPAANCSVNVKIYAARNQTSHISGTKLFEKTFKCKYAGYSRLSLGKKIGIPKGSRFGIVVTIKTSDGKYFVPFEAQDIDEPVNYPAVVRKGQTYIKTDGKWKPITTSTIVEDDGYNYRLYSGIIKGYGLKSGTKAQKIKAKSRIRIRKGRSKSLRAKRIKGKGKLLYKTSNGKIAAVSAKGVVKAKKKGTVKITIYTLPTVKYKSAKKIVTVKVN